MTITTYPALTELPGFPLRVFVSHGGEDRGRAIATLAAGAMDWLGRVTGKRVRPELVVADVHDWPTVCEIPIYGMPFSLPNKLATSTTPGAWWHDYVEVLRPHLGEPASTALAATFGDPPDYTTLADLIITHEATHLFHEIHPVTWASEFPADWVMELFANLGMHGYLASHAPEQLRLVTVMVDATIDAGNDLWRLQDLDLMGQSMHVSVPNYVWYEFRLLNLAGQLWDATGELGLRDYQRMLGDPELSHRETEAALAKLEPAVADAVHRWPEP